MRLVTTAALVSFSPSGEGKSIDPEQTCWALMRSIIYAARVFTGRCLKKILHIGPHLLVIGMIAMGHQAMSQTPTQPTNTPPSTIRLVPSADTKINEACHLALVEKDLEKTTNKTKQGAIIGKFNDCVKTAESAPQWESAKSDLLILGTEKPPGALTGATGATGVAAATGATGTTGATGVAAATGATGTTGATGSVGTTGASGSVAQQPAVQQLSQGQQLTGSTWGTPDACATGTAGALAAKGLLYVHRSLVLPQQASDDFGRRLGKRFLVYEVSITNAVTDFQYSVSDIVVDLKPIYSRLNIQPVIPNVGDVPTPAAAYEASSQDLSMLRGVPEKGQDYDPRNMTLHILQGVGAVGAGISGLTPFSDVMGSAMANFNGAFLQAFTGIAPDHTPTQLNRLSDMAFTSNTLVGKLQTKKFAIFIPEAFVMPKGDQGTYWSDPRTELNKLPFDQLNVCVDGILLVQASTTSDPTFSAPAGNIAPGTSIVLADSDTGATIYYTTDNSAPTVNSTKYSTPIIAGAAGSPPLTIRMFASATGKSPSNTVSATFSSVPPAPAH